MKHTLPWNVTGIPPEAREIARSAAGREGIPVGEWLTRRILAESARAEGAGAESGRAENIRPANGRAKSAVDVPQELAPPYRYGRDEEILRDRDDLAARFAHSEAESENAFRRIDDALRTMARRVESSERAQTEANRAMGSAAAEINAAARDQAQAFKLLTNRIDSVERQTDTAALRDAVRALHQGLSRLTDQIAKTANDSTEQIAALTRNTEMLTGRIANVREESQRLGQSVEDRFAAFDERIKESERRIESSLGLEERLRQAEEGIAANSVSVEVLPRLEARLRQAEGNIGSNAASVEILPRLEARLKQAEGNIASNSASTQILTRLEARLRQAEENIASNSASEEILTRLEARLKQIEESIASSAASEGIETRLEARLSFAEERTHEALERHFASMGRNLEDLASRLEKTESRADPDAGIQDALRSLGTRIDAAEKKNREALADLEANLREAAKRIENFENAPPTTGPLAPLPELTPLPEEEAAAEAQFDLPPFPEEPLLDVEHQQKSGEVEYFSQAAPQAAETIASELPQDHTSPENYLDQARRAAQAAAEPETERGKRAKFRIPFPGEAELALAGVNPPRRSWRGTQPLAFTALLLLLVVSGYQITRNLFRESQVVSMELNRPAAPNRPSTPAPAATEKTAGATDLAAIPAETPAEESVSAVTAPQPTASGVAKAPAVPVQTAAPAAQPTPANLAQNASVAGLSRLTAQANSGDAKAALALGLKYANGDGVALNDVEAMRWLQKAAEAGEPLAQYRLGTFFEKGRAVAPDQDQALRWYGEAAQHGNRKAMHALGVANANGIGGKKNFPEAVRWFKAAAELGLTDSQFNLAVLYERGLGVQTSLPEAYKWYAIAAAAGDSESKTRVAALATEISAAERDAADRVAKGYKPQPMNVAANDGPPLTPN